MDPMKTTLEDVINRLREKGAQIRDKVSDEASDLKKAWFKYLLEKNEEIDERLAKLESRVEELEKNECKCGHDESNDVRPNVL